MPNVHRTLDPDSSAHPAAAEAAAVAQACRTNRIWAASIVVVTVVVFNLLVLLHATLVIALVAALLVMAGGAVLAWLAGVDLLTGLRLSWRHRA